MRWHGIHFSTTSPIHCNLFYHHINISVIDKPQTTRLQQHETFMLFIYEK